MVGIKGRQRKLLHSRVGVADDGNGGAIASAGAAIGGAFRRRCRAA
jgi:hypothetical protein